MEIRWLAPLALLALVPATALAVKIPDPPTGKYDLVEGNSFSYAKAGSLKVTDERKIKKLVLTPTEDRADQCGTKPLRVVGKLPITKATRAGVSIWIFGKNRPKTDDGIAPREVTFRQDGKRLTGKMEMAFHTSGRTTHVSTELDVATCQYYPVFIKRQGRARG